MPNPPTLLSYKPQFLGGWWPGILFLASLLMSVIVPTINPWVISISGTLLLMIGFVIEWRVQLSKHRKEETQAQRREPTPPS